MAQGLAAQQQRPWKPGGASASQKQDGTTTACAHIKQWFFHCRRMAGCSSDAL